MGAGASSKYQNPEYLDKLIVDDIEKKGGARFAGMDNKPALLRTYYATCSGGYEDDYIEKHEFRAMLRNLFFFTKLWTIFQEVDSSEKYKDRRITLPEFQRFCASNDLGVTATADQAADMFRDADVNDGGMLLFDEFCKFVADQLVPMSKHDAEYAAMEQPTTELGGDEACESCLVVPVNKTRRGKHGSKNKRRDKRFGASKSKLKREAKRFAKCTADFAEMQLNKKSLARAWAALDYNGNGMVSLAEIDKWVLEHWPVLNSKPALLNAYQDACAGGSDAFVQRDEFRGLLGHLVAYARVWDLFYEFDSAKELIKEFDRIDENDGGLILFKEFARFAKTKTLSSGVPAELAAVASATELEAMGWSRLSAYCANLGLDDRGKTADLANRLFTALFPKDP
ncbi:hypothetical protein JL722_7435 [Aureococcus anophagefferens]|nr:hypothetical protein JL722_7435 [Aureococcus anophagefferens]